VRSALSQEGVAVEVHVLDDSPEGSARPAIEALGDARVRYTQRAVPTGGKPSVVRNEGGRQATGRFIHFLDDDDRVATGAYAAMSSALDASGAGVAFGLIEPFGEEASAVSSEQRYFADAARRARRAAALRSPRWMVTNMMFRDTVLVNSACLIRREAFSALEGYDADLKLCEDVEFYVRAIRRFGFAFLERVVLHYRVGHVSLMHDSPQQKDLLATYESMYAKYRRDYGAAEFRALQLLARTVMRWV
jgi:glycosyltransferase involved in cell wall biosynthesis